MLGFYYSTDKIVRIMFIVCFYTALLIMFLNQSQLSALSSTRCPLPPPSVYNVTQPSVQGSRLVAMIEIRFCAGLKQARAYNRIKLTLWRPLLPHGYSYKASCARSG